MTIFFDRAHSLDLSMGPTLRTDGIANVFPGDPRSPSALTRLSAQQSSSSVSPSKRLVVIDGNVQDYTSLAAKVLPDEAVLILDSQRDGLTQISEALAQTQNLSSLYLVSHGGPGYVQLGNSIVDAKVLSSHSAEIQHWSSALTPNADILLYGCDVTANEQGLQFVQQLHRLTNADIAASIDLTGSQTLGGNWNLETTIGAIKSPFPFQAEMIDAYQATLATTYLSDLNATSVTNGWGPMEKDKSNGEAAAGDGKTLSLHGVTYAKGLGTHAGSELNYALNGAYTSFSSSIGVDDESGGRGSVLFQVWADGTKLYDSGMLTGSSAKQLVNVAVAGKQALKLVITDAGDGKANDHADWADAKLTTGTVTPPPSAPPSSGMTTYLSDLNATSVTNGWGPMEKDKSNGEAAAGDGKTLSLHGVTYAKGLGTHAGSELNYALNGAYTSFSSSIGVDDESGGRGSVLFQVWADGTKLYDSGMLTGSSAKQLVNVAVAGKQALKLVITDAGDGKANDHADWADAKLTTGTVTPPPVSETTAPTGTLAAAALNTSINGPYAFTVTYADATAVKLDTINGTTTASDIRVTGANGFSQLASLVRVTPNTNGRSLTATYQITAPDGSWGTNDNGTYTATLLAGQVSDTLGNTTTADTTLGTFQVAVPTVNPSGSTLSPAFNDTWFGRNDAHPDGVPSYYSWYENAGGIGWGNNPRTDWHSFTAWGQVYAQEGWHPGSSPNTRVQIENLDAWYLSKATGQWVQLQHAERVEGAAFVSDFGNNGSMSSATKDESANGGGISVTAGDGYNYHFWTGRTAIDPTNIAGVYTRFQAKLTLNAPSGPDDRSSSHYLASAGADYWRSNDAAWAPDWSNNGGVGGGRLKFVTNEWQNFSMETLTPEQLSQNPPPLNSLGVAGP